LFREVLKIAGIGNTCGAQKESVCLLKPSQALYLKMLISQHSCLYSI